jgi:hypothetical protein
MGKLANYWPTYRVDSVSHNHKKLNGHLLTKSFPSVASPLMSRHAVEILTMKETYIPLFQLMSRHAVEILTMKDTYIPLFQLMSRHAVENLTMKDTYIPLFQLCLDML